MVSKSRRDRGIGRVAALAIPLLALLSVSAGWVARDAASAQKKPTRAEIVAQLPRELSPARMRADLRAFERIADRFGGNRAGGTAGYRASVGHIRAELTRAGHSPRVVGFPFVEYRESVEKGVEIPPIRRELRVEALDYSPSTPKGGLRAQVVAADDGCESGDFEGARGFIALAFRLDGLEVLCFERTA